MKEHLFKNEEALQFLKSLDNDSIDMILTDPPYFGVVSDDWDNQWSNENDFLSWLELLLIEYKRVLKKHGSFYLFCDTKRSINVQQLISKHFNVLQNIRWVKNNGRFQQASKKNMRNYFHQTETIIFAEHYISDYEIDLIKREVFKPLISYMRDSLLKSGLSKKDIESLICKANGKDKTNMFYHYFNDSQFTIPTQRVYNYLKDNTQSFDKTYEELKELNKELNNKFKDILRPFNIDDRQFTDILNYRVIPSSKTNRHMCEKPVDLLTDLILTSSRCGDLVLDTFAGSGSTYEACIKTNRLFYGCELDIKWFNSVNDRIKSI